MTEGRESYERNLTADPLWSVTCGSCSAHYQQRGSWPSCCGVCGSDKVQVGQVK